MSVDHSPESDHTRLVHHLNDRFVFNHRIANFPSDRLVTVKERVDGVMNSEVDRLRSGALPVALSG
jgi:hypothetical protein